MKIVLLLFFLCSTIANAGNLTRVPQFKEVLKKEPIDEKNKLCEMALSSDNILLFHYACTQLIKNQYLHALKTLKTISSQKGLSQQKQKTLFSTIKKLEYYSKKEGEPRITFLQQELFDKLSPTTHQSLFKWALLQFGEIAQNRNRHILRNLVKQFPQLSHYGKTTMEKIRLNTVFFGKNNWKLHRSISATGSNNPEVRDWGLEQLSKTDHPEAARYLTLLYQQNNATAAQLTFSQIKTWFKLHQKRFPHLYNQ